MKRIETVQTVVTFAGSEDCQHRFAQGPTEGISETVTRMTFICSGCLREETRTRTFTYETDPAEYAELKKLEKSKAKPYVKTANGT